MKFFTSTIDQGLLKLNHIMAKVETLNSLESAY